MRVRLGGDEMKKKIKWVLVLCSVLIPVYLSTCKQGTVEKQGSSNKEVQKKIDRTNIHFDKTGPAATFDWEAKNSIRYITFENLPQYMRSDDSDGISIYGQQPNEASLSEEGRVQKALQVVEGVYVDQSRIDTVIKANGAKNQEDMYTRLWNDYIIPKIEKNSSTFDPNTYVEYLGEKYPLKIYGPMYLKLMTNALRFEKKYELKGYAVKDNKVFIRIQVPTYFPELLMRGDYYYKNPNWSDFNQRFFEWLDELHQRYAEKETNRDDRISYIMLSTLLQQLVDQNFNARSSSGYTNSSGELRTTEFTVEMEVTDQGDIRIDSKNLAILLQIPQQMKGENKYGKGDENNIFWTIPSGSNSDGQKIKEKLKKFNPKDPVKSYAIGTPVVFANGLEVTLNSVTDDPNLDVQDDQNRIDKSKNQHRLIVEFTLSNPTPLRIESYPNYSNVDLYDGQGKSAYMLNNTLNYKQPTVLEAGEKYKINYLTDGDGLFTVVYGDAKWVIQK